MNSEPNKLKPMGIQSKETVDLAAAKAQDAVSRTRETADEALDKAKANVDSTQAGTADAMDKTVGAKRAPTDETKDRFLSAAEKARAQAANVSGKVANYAQEDPLKSMLIAAAAGALVMGLLTLIVRSRD